MSKKGNYDIKPFINDNCIAAFFCSALLVCTIFTGGLNWYSCIIPLIMISICLVFKFKDIKTNAVIYSVGLLILIIMSFFTTKGDFQTGIYEVEKFMLFILSLLLGTVIRKKENIISGIYICSVVSAMFGLIVYCGLIEPGEYLLKYSGQIRLQSFFKYANTAACFSGMGYYACMGIFKRTKKNIHLYFGTVILIAMYLTISKATIPLFLLIGFYYIYRKKEIAVIYVNNNFWIFLFILPIMKLAEKHLYFATFSTIIICIILSVNVKIVKKNETAIKLWIIILVIGIVGGSVLFIIKQSLFSTFIQRLTYMKDSLKLLCDNIWLGNGIGSWRVLKYSFQSTGYNVTYMHNSFLQFLFENGFIFTALFLFLIVKAIIFSVKNRNDCFGAVLLLLISHSLIDFDLSFGVILMILGVICGNLCFNNSLKEKNEFGGMVIKIFLLIVVNLCFGYMIA